MGEFVAPFLVGVRVDGGRVGLRLRDGDRVRIVGELVTETGLSVGIEGVSVGTTGESVDGSSCATVAETT